MSKAPRTQANDDCLPLRGKHAVLQYLAKKGLLESKALIVLFMSESLVPLEAFSQSLETVSEQEAKNLALKAVHGKVAGILLIEVHVGRKPWPFKATTIKSFRDELEKVELPLLDVLVVEEGRISSSFFRTR